MGYNKEAKYMTGLKPVNSEFTYKIGEEGEYYVDHANGYDRVNDVIDALTNAINTYNTTRDDIAGMIKAYVLEEEVSLNQLLDYLTGGMGEALQTVSDKTKEVIEEMIRKLEAAEKTNEQLVEEQEKATNEIKNGEAEDPDKTNKPISSGEEAPEKSEEKEKPNNNGEMRDIDEINERIEEFGGNGKYSIYKDAEKSGNKEAYMENINNLVTNLEGVEKQFNADGKGYSFQSTVFSGGKHATGSGSPTHGMGAKADIRWYKNGVQLEVGNATSEDWEYIRSVLGDNNLGVQFEKHNTVWGDVFLNEAKNVHGETVSYDGSSWGDDASIYYTK